MSGPASYSIRRASAADIPAMRAIEDSAGARFATIPALADLAEDDLLPSTIHEWLEAGRVYVAVDKPTHDEHTIGFVAAHPLDGALHITQISVRGDSHGRGAGTALLHTVYDWAREEGGMGTVSLTTYANVPWNGPWYQRRGFREVAAAHMGPGHTAAMEAERPHLDREGFRRCCMVWDGGS